VSRPGLWERLDGPPRVTVVSAPPGSGKTVLLRSWIGEAGLGERAAWVLVGRDERHVQRLWLSVLGTLRQTVPGQRLSWLKIPRIVGGGFIRPSTRLGVAANIHHYRPER
jgi:ATP/maltotriose-dependent transcriptional regulator MalT